jgi:hypothetical protein
MAPLTVADMVPGVRYIVTRESENNEFIKDDNIWMDNVGRVHNANANGWMDRDDVQESTKGMNMIIDKHFYIEKIKYLRSELKECEIILDSIDTSLSTNCNSL